MPSTEPLDVLLGQYRTWMLNERGLSDSTVLRYENTARRFLREHAVRAGVLSAELLTGGDVNASASVGLMQAVTTETAKHLTATRLQHVGQSLAQQLPSRTKLAQLQIATDRACALVADTVSAVESGRADAQLLVLEVKAVGDEGAATVPDLAMAACGGAALRKEFGLERRFRDSRAARVMAPTTDALHDFVGRALCELPLLDA